MNHLARRCADEGRPSPDQDQDASQVTATFAAISTLMRLGWEGPPCQPEEEEGVVAECHIRTFPLVPHYQHHRLVIILSSAIFLLLLLWLPL